MEWSDPITMVIGLVALILSISAVKQAKGNNETSVMNLYFSEYKNFNEVFARYKNANSANDKEKEYWHEKCKYAYQEYYNALDYMCIKYLNKELSEATFAGFMSDEIVAVCRDSKKKSTP